MLAIGLSLCFAAVVRAVSPTCGELYGTPANLNAGILLSNISTIVAFGDGFTSGGTTDGSPLPPPVQDPPNPRAGGRVANGPVWVEYLADSISATLRDFAVPSSVIDNTQYPQLKDTLDPRDFLTQANKVITLRQKPDPASTLYVLYLGMEDYKIKDRVTPFDTLAGAIIYESLKLASSPLFAKNILFVDSYALGDRTADGESYREQLFSGVSALHDHPKVDLNVGFVDFGEFFAGLKSDVQAAGFDELGPCTVSANTTEGQCSNPDKVVYYIEDYPSTETHKLMSEFAQTALETCSSS